MAPTEAQQAAVGGSSTANGGDPGVVITRTVQPRIAYRGVPLQDNPIRAKATTFPGQVFRGTLDRILGQVVGDAALGQRGSVGLGALAAGQAAPPGAPATLNTGAWFGPAAARGASAVPTGPTAAIAGAVGGATAGLGDTISSAVLRAVGPTLKPTEGGGP